MDWTSELREWADHRPETQVWRSEANFANWFIEDRRLTKDVVLEAIRRRWMIGPRP